MSLVQRQPMSHYINIRKVTYEFDVLPSSR